MGKEELEAIIEKYRKKSENRSFFGDDKCAEFEEIADYIEDNMFVLIDVDLETEEDVICFVKEDISMGINHYDKEDYINMGLLDEPYDE